jgi:hypothetical protein
VIAFKFLCPEAVSPFTGFRWPAPGEWVSAPAPRASVWVYACRPADLPHWLAEELWRIELADPVTEARYQISSPRARLVERVSAWGPGMARDYATACALRARDLALPHLAPALRDLLAGAAELEAIATAARRTGAAPGAANLAELVADAAGSARRGRIATTSYIAAAIAASVGGGLDAFDEERGWQARWLEERLGLGARGARTR